MDSVSSYSKISLPQFSPLQFKNTLLSKRSLAIVASSSSSSSDKNKNNVMVDSELSGLTAPLVLRTEAGRSMSGALLSGREGLVFHAVAEKELVKLSYMKDDAFLRMNLSLCSDEAVLHRRIAELRELECRNAVEDVMYMLIVYKFSEIGVHLVPKLSKCMHNGRLVIWPCKDWELESIHSVEELEMVKRHLSALTGWKEKSNMKDNWALTQVQNLHIRRVYEASIVYGYFLKSASLRYHLEQSLDHINSDLGAVTTSSNLLFSRSWPLKPKSIPFGRVSDTRSTSVGPVSLIEGKKQESLRSYVMSLDNEIVQMCARPKFKETTSLIEKHCSALFGDESDEVVSTSLACLKRFVLEAVGFGSFLWDAEDYVRTFYRLEEN